MELFATGQAPERLDPDAQKVLRAGIRAIHEETLASTDFEGKTGVSPRGDPHRASSDAAQSPAHAAASRPSPC